MICQFLNSLLVLCSFWCVGFAFGLGLLQVLPQLLDRRSQFLLAPFVATLAWVFFLALAVLTQNPLGKVWILGWTATFAIALSALISFRRVQVSYALSWVLMAAGVSSLPIIFYFWHGIFDYPGSPALDGWSYVAYAQYLWSYPRGTEGGLAPLYQYATHLNETRFMGSALLAFFSPWTGSPGNCKAAVGLFLGWGLFVFATSVAFFGYRFKFQGIRLAGLILLCGFSPWLTRLVAANNYDNLLALSFPPVLLAWVGTMSLRSRVDWGFFSISLAALSFVYPEMFPPVAAVSFLVLAGRLFANGDFRKTISAAGVGMIPGLFFAASNGPQAFRFFKQQAAAAAVGMGPRPGEGMFRNLLDGWTGLRAFWGLDAGAGTGMEAFLQIIALLLFLIVGFATWRMFFDVRLWALPLTFLIFFAGTLFMVFEKKYDYGAYKLITINIAFSWALVVWGVENLDSVSGRIPMKIMLKKASAILLATVVVLVSVLSFKEARRVDKILKATAGRNMSIYRELSELLPSNKSDGVLILAENPLNSLWACYYLRDRPSKMGILKSYMDQSHVKPYMARSEAIPIENIKYVVTDKIFEKEGSAWAAGSLYQIHSSSSKHAWIAEVKSPNGIEEWNKKRAFWIGNKDVEIVIWSLRDMQVLLGGEWAPGPSLERGGRADLNIGLVDHEEKQSFTKAEFREFNVSLQQGRNIIRLVCPQKPVLDKLSNGDTRSMILGVSDIRLKN
jgi:hypothetical protein